MSRWIAMTCLKWQDQTPLQPATTAVSRRDISEGVEVRFDGSCPNEYFLQRRWTVTDYCGNESIWEQIVTVHDVTAPESRQPTSDQTVECDGMGNMDGVEHLVGQQRWCHAAADACSGVIWSNDFTGLSDDCGTTGSATDCDDFHCHRRVWLATAVRRHATFTIEDTMAPVFDDLHPHHHRGMQ